MKSEPGRYVLPGLSKRLVEAPVVGLETPHKCPETPGVIHVPGVTELVDHQVAHQFGVEEQQAVVDADRAPGRVTPPAGLLAADVHLPERAVRPGRQRRELRLELGARHAAEPALQCADTELLVPNPARQDNLVTGRRPVPYRNDIGLFVVCRRWPTSRPPVRCTLSV